MKNDLPMADGQLPVAEQSGGAVSPLTAVGAHGVTRPARSIANRESQIVNGFTLVELLVVISIIAILAAFTVPVLSAVKKRQYINQTQGELGQLKAAIDSYHAAYGFYPPSNSNYDPNNPVTRSDAMFSPLYFELLGTTNKNSLTYQTLDGSASIAVSALTASTTPLGVGGFMNCSKPGAAEDAPAARNFLLGLKPNQYALNITNNPPDPVNPVTLLLGSVGGPDATYKPLGTSGLNPWRYVSPGINNPNSYDLWIQLVIHGKTYLICNWSKQVQVNNPLP
jgi:prepilin-type N-terminal cleavage/methylation domain-containing protein